MYGNFLVRDHPYVMSAPFKEREARNWQFLLTFSNAYFLFEAGLKIKKALKLAQALCFVLMDGMTYVEVRFMSRTILPGLL